MTTELTAPQSKGLAITGFVLSLVGIVICGPLGIVGLIISIIALSKASSRPEAFGGKGFAIAGLILGILSILATVLSIAILLPALGKARGAARQVVSLSQARQIMQGLVLYANDHGDHYPPADADWVALLVDSGYVEPDAFVSPFAEDPTVISYFLVPAGTLEFDSSKVVLYEMPGLNPDGVVFGYDDNHVAIVRAPEAERIIAGLRLPDGTPWAPHLDPRDAP